jgi:putative endonuclease
MSDHNQLGEEGEKAAAEYLLGKSYAILEMNWRHRKYELDIIASKGKFLVVVEVKTRQGRQLVEAVKAVTREKQRNLVRAANAYVQMNGLKEEVRFDIIVIDRQGEKQEISHIEDAFYPLL